MDTLSDNNNRTVADLRSLFSKAGGTLGTTGSVAFLFDQRAVFEIPVEADGRAPLTEDDLFLLVADAGADDLRREDADGDAEGDDDAQDLFIVDAPVEAFGAVSEALAGAGIEPSEAGLVRHPTTTTALEPGDAASVLRLLDALDDHQDIQTVTSTLDDAALAEIGE